MHPVVQFERLCGDLSALDDVDCDFVVVSWERRQQLKDVLQLDGWLRNGLVDYLDSISLWE